MRRFIAVFLVCLIVPTALAVEPEITSIEPQVGKALEELRILGRNFGGAAGNSVTIGGAGCQITNILDWEIRCIIPYGDGANLPVKFSNANGATNTLPFSYHPAPAIVGITPDSVTAAGGTLTIGGYRFGEGAQVSIGGTPCPIVAMNQNNIACTIPTLQPGVHPLTVTVNGLTSNVRNFTFTGTVTATAAGGSGTTEPQPTSAPVINSVTPTGAAGGTMRIQGSGLAGGGQAPRVTIGGVNCTVTGYSGTTVDCTIPIGDGASLPVVLTHGTTNLASNSMPFSYDATPAITAISPTSYTSTILTVTGYRFMQGTTVSIGAASCPVTFQRAGVIYCTIPSGSGVQPVTVAAGGLRSNAVNFTFGVGPTVGSGPSGPWISSVSPATAQPGAALTINGGGWGTAGASAVIAGAPCAITSQTESQIVCTIPAGSGSTLPVLVVNAAGAWSDPEPFTYGTPQPHASWTALNFEATDIAVGANGQVWFIGGNGSSIYRVVNGTPQLMSGSAARITVDPNGVAWVVNSAATIWRWTGSTWAQTPGSAQDIGAGGSGVWVTGPDKTIHRWTGTTWSGISGAGTSIATDSSGLPWVVNAGNIWRYNGSSWAQVAGVASDIAVAGTHVVAVGAGGVPQRLVNGAWQSLGGATGLRIAVAPDGKIYLARGAGQPAMIYQ